MKRVIAVSDSHGMTFRLRQVLCHAFSRGTVDAIAFLGDGLEDFEKVGREFTVDHPGLRLYAVRGNNDWSASAPLVDTFTLDGVKFFLCHGHQYRVKYGLERLQMEAVAQEAQVALFGHTHLGYLAPEYGCLFVNPGAVCSYGSDAPLYAQLLLPGDGQVKADLFTAAVL